MEVFHCGNCTTAPFLKWAWQVDSMAWAWLRKTRTVSVFSHYQYPSGIKKSLHDLCRAVIGTEMLKTLSDVVRQANHWSTALLVRAVLELPFNMLLVE